MTPDEARIVAETEARIVAYLRDGGTTKGFQHASLRLRVKAAWLSFRRPWAFAQAGCRFAADAIERGDHRKDTTNGRRDNSGGAESGY